MAKKKSKKKLKTKDLARDYWINTNLSCKEIGLRLGVTDRCVQGYVQDLRYLKKKKKTSKSAKKKPKNEQTNKIKNKGVASHGEDLNETGGSQPSTPSLTVITRDLVEAWILANDDRADLGMRFLHKFTERSQKEEEFLSKLEGYKNDGIIRNTDNSTTRKTEAVGKSLE